MANIRVGLWRHQRGRDGELFYSTRETASRRNAVIAEAWLASFRASPRFKVADKTDASGLWWPRLGALARAPSCAVRPRRARRMMRFLAEFGFLQRRQRL